MNMPEAITVSGYLSTGDGMSFSLMEPGYTLPAEQRRRAKIVATLGPSL